MRRSFSLGALALHLCLGALVPAMVNSAKAASRDSSDSDERPQSAVFGAQVAIKSELTGADAASPAPATDLTPEPLLPQFKAPSTSPQVLQASTGQASWYGPGFYGGRTANGERFRPGTLTAAHRTLPFGTRVRVTNLWNGRTAVVRINDRGPFYGNRVIDLAHGAAQELGVASTGVAQVKLEVLR